MNLAHNLETSAARGEQERMPKTGRRILSMFLLGFLLLLLCPSRWTQSKSSKRDAPSKSQSSYSAKVNLVVVKATVTDKSGSPVTDLTRKDFRVYDDGKLQDIQTFELESIEAPVAKEEKEVSGSTSPNQTQKKQNAPSPRLISIVIDDLTMEAPASDRTNPGTILEFPRIIKSIKKFVESDVSPADQVAFLSGSRKVQFPFSNNKKQLLEELDAIGEKLNFEWATREMSDLEAWLIAKGEPDLPHIETDGGAILKREWTKFAAIRQTAELEFRTRNLLETIRQNLRTLRHFEGAKTVVIFSDGFLSEKGTFEAHQIQELVNLALHSGIILNTVSTRWISTEDSASPGPDSLTVVSGSNDLDRLTQEKPMVQMASETGGLFSHQRNDIYLGLRDVAHHSSSYYVLTYAMPAHKADGAYHRITMELTRPGMDLSYRKGYYAPKEEMTFENSKKEDLLEALNAPGDMNQIPMTLSYNYSQEDDSTYSVSFITNVNIRGLQFLEEDARRKDQVSLALAAFDETDHFISGLEKTIDFQLLESSYVSLREQGLTSRVELKLPVGRYKIKAVARETVQGKMGSITKSVEIP
jgi:VWFA-related protein